MRGRWKPGLLASVAICSSLATSTERSAALDSDSDELSVGSGEVEIGGLLKDPATRAYAERFQVDLNVAARSLALQPVAELLNLELTKRAPERFGGIVMENDDDSTIRVMSTDANLFAEIIAEYAAVDNAPEVNFRFVLVKHTEQELNKAHDALFQALNLKYGLKWSSFLLSYVDLDRNRVVAQIDDDSPEDLRVWLGHQHPQVAVERSVHPISGLDESCTRLTCSPPFRGGLEIYPHAGNRCTAGFVGKDTPTGNWLLITAGHCVNHTGETWRHSGTEVGNANRWNNSNRVDAALLENFLHMWNPGNSIFRDSNPNYPISAKTIGPVVGTWICRSGAVHQETCGSIMATNASVNNKNWQIRIQDAKACGGDSGGPWFSVGNSSGSAFGTHVTSTVVSNDCPSQPWDEDSFATKVIEIEQMWNVSVFVGGK